MPNYPVDTFQTFDQLLAFINTNWVENGLGEITGIEGNSVVNGLLTFIRQSPLNYQTADIFNGGGDIEVQRPIDVFSGITPTSLKFGDNVYNQYVFINRTDSAIPLFNGLVYYDINAAAQTAIPARNVVIIYKAKNGLWIQGNTIDGVAPSVSLKSAFFQVVVGVTRDSNDNIIMNEGDTQLIISQANVQNDSIWISFGGIELPREADGVEGTIYYGSPIYEADKVTINFIQGFGLGDKLIFHYTYIA
jgi:hypothetical protein